MKKLFFTLMFLPLVTACDLSSLPKMAAFPNVDLQNPTENWLGDSETLQLSGTFDAQPGTTIDLTWDTAGEATVGSVTLDQQSKLSVGLPRPGPEPTANALDRLSGLNTGVKLYRVAFFTQGSSPSLPETWLEGDWNFGGLSTNNIYVYAPEDATYVKLGQKVAHRENGVYVSVKFKKGWNKLYQHFDAQFGRVLLTTSYHYTYPRWESVWNGKRGL